MTVEEMAKLETHSVKWFVAAFEGCTARNSAKFASTRICKAYGIKGQSDPAYIAHVIESELTKKSE